MLYWDKMKLESGEIQCNGNVTVSDEAIFFFPQHLKKKSALKNSKQ